MNAEATRQAVIRNGVKPTENPEIDVMLAAGTPEEAVELVGAYAVLAQMAAQRGVAFPRIPRGRTDHLLDDSEDHNETLLGWYTELRADYPEFAALINRMTTKAKADAIVMYTVFADEVAANVEK